MKISLPVLSRGRVVAAMVVLLAVAVGAFGTVTKIITVNGLIKPSSDAVSVPATPPLIGDAIVGINEATLAPGDVIGFHYHTGYAYSVVKSGTLTEDDGCGNVVTHSAGTAFVEVPGHVHEVRNEDPTVTVDLYWAIIHPADKRGTYFVSSPTCEP